MHVCMILQESVPSSSGEWTQRGSSVSLSADGSASDTSLLTARRVVIVATASQIFIFEGSSNLETLFARYAAVRGWDLVMGNDTMKLV